MGKVSSFESRVGKMKTSLTTSGFIVIFPNSHTKDGIKITNLSY